MTKLQATKGVLRIVIQPKPAAYALQYKRRWFWRTINRYYLHDGPEKAFALAGEQKEQIEKNLARHA